MKAILYIDGFNFYYGAARRFNVRWVNPLRLAQLLLPDYEFTRVRYFSAIVKPDPSDPTKISRQHTYLRALRTLPYIDIQMGAFLQSVKSMPKHPLKSQTSLLRHLLTSASSVEPQTSVIRHQSSLIIHRTAGAPIHSVNLDQAISRLYHLKVDTTTRDGDGSPHEKPHKPLLLLAALDLIDEGLASPDRIPWSQELRDPASRATPGHAAFRPASKSCASSTTATTRTCPSAT